MRTSRFFAPIPVHVVILAVALAGGLVACAESSLNKQEKAHGDLALAEDTAAAAAVKAGDTAGAAQHTAAAAAERQRVADLEKTRQAARDADTNAWTMGSNSAGGLANIWFPGVGGVLVGALGTIAQQIMRRKTFTDGQTQGQNQGATAATTAITNADTANTLQAPAVKAALTDQLVGQPANIVAAVHAAI